MLKQILLGTKNQSKIKRYQNFLKSDKYHFLTLPDLNLKNILTPVEDGRDEIQNARIKAESYFEASGIGTIAEDSGLYFEGLDPHEQPGKHIKRKAGIEEQLEKTLSKDDQFKLITDYYINIANRFGGEVEGYFLDAYCYIENNLVLESTAKRKISLTNKIHQIDLNFPLCSLYLVNQKPYHQLNQDEMQTFLKPSLEAAQSILARL